MQALADSSVELWQSKVLIVGEAAVGKTTLARQLRGDDFDADEGQTHGVRIHPLVLPHPSRPGVEMKLDAWDFGGQLEYRATQRFYLTDRSLFILVWSSRSRAADGKVVPWLDVVTARAPGSPVIIVATHSDEHSPATLPADLSGRYRQISAIHAIDSRTGTGIADLSRIIADRAAALPLMGMRWPTSWLAAAQAVRDLPGLTATQKVVFGAMAHAGLKDVSAQRGVARVLHDLGQIVFFADRPELAAKVILQPAWLDARITQVIDSDEVTASGGVLSRVERLRLWGDLAEDDPELPDRLISMMEAFDLAYRVGDQHSDDVALIVDRLPEAPPPQAEEVWREHSADPRAREISIIYRLASRQAGIPTWFIAREHRYTTGMHWRSGALLHDRDPHSPAWALITDDGREQPTVTIRVSGAFPVRFLSVLTEAFDNIVEDRYPGLVEQRLIPCACPGVDGAGCSHAFGLDELLAEATDLDPDADHKVRCPKTRKKIEAALMLDGLRGTGLIAELETIERHMAAQFNTLNRIDAGQQAMLNGIRSLLENRANAGVQCPAVFSIQARGRTRIMRRDKLVLSLWCEWPTEAHVLADGVGDYPINTLPEALLGYLPYLRFLIQGLGILAPTALAAGLSERVQASIEAAAATMEIIADHSAAIARKQVKPSHIYQWADIGANLRALRELLERLDPDHSKNWGGLSPVSRPEDRRVMFLCPEHVAALNYPYVAGGSAPSA
ncbi:COR domain-containing protein [Catenulispora yoronensis]